MLAATYPRLIWFISLFLGMITGPTYGQKPQKSAKKPMLTITHPVSKIKVVFSDPAFLDKRLDDSAWKRMTVYLPSHHSFVISAASKDGFMMNSDAEDRWSPDGQFMSVWTVYSIIDKDQYSGMRIEFVSLADGTLTHFRTKTGSAVTTDDFSGWYGNKPHVVKKATVKRGEYEEAYGPDGAQH